MEDFNYAIFWKDEINGHGFHFYNSLKECENAVEWYKGLYSHVVIRDLLNNVALYVYDEAE